MRTLITRCFLVFIFMAGGCAHPPEAPENPVALKLETVIAVGFARTLKKPHYDDIRLIVPRKIWSSPEISDLRTKGSIILPADKYKVGERDAFLVIIKSSIQDEVAEIDVFEGWGTSGQRKTYFFNRKQSGEWELKSVEKGPIAN